MHQTHHFVGMLRCSSPEGIDRRIYVVNRNTLDYIFSQQRNSRASAARIGLYVMRLYDFKTSDQVFEKASQCSLTPWISQWR